MAPDDALQTVIAVCAVGHAIHSLELIAAHRSDKLLLVHLVRAQERGRPSLLGSPRVFRVLMSVRLGLAVATVAMVISQKFMWPILALLCLTSLYHAWYRRVGGDGAEEMGLVVLVAATFSSGPFETATPIGLYFIGAQCLLAYFAAGVAKLFSATWRNGLAVGRVTATETYGLKSVHTVLQSHPSVGRLLTWLSLGFEVLLPPAVFLWSGAAPLLVVTGLLFHCSCAVVMGLNGFPVPFAATYPAVLFLSAEFHRSF